ncbi:MAG: tRNA glutamyl-Q(34) synthetase GluQRS, partial [Rhodospirillaceae bacterium]|nr:tRNA glutamyl-Q(34) synthetase GluQRS [Rhodospirillaceae bacterium]
MIKNPATNTSIVTRFAPSPSGHLHLGHAYSAWFAQANSQANAGGGRLLLRIEDIDQTRCRPEFEAVVLDDLAWLGLTWEEPVRRQSDHMADYAAALKKLDEMGVIYPCFCTRKEIRAEIKRMNEAPHDAPNKSVGDKRGPVYPGTCRVLYEDDRDLRMAAGDPYALRLNMQKAIYLAEQKRGNLTWIDLDQGEQRATPEIFGDVVLARKDEPTSY